LLGINPVRDTHGALLRIDYYSIRAREYEYLLQFVEGFSTQIYGNTESDKISCLKLLPNIMMTTSFAKLQFEKPEEEYKNHNESITDSLTRIN
jgi:hypothetical protein